ncbi:unnamed protein product [Cyclocybe aegerita]|uniref:Uncharacterized protein n=1 Tax=Cyclocybe aegerita TaxID=1973307 RepID=A0A8S0WXA5_CYCAE|nr:unnamed protein product [Cyclocybe aegerita]
MIAANTARKVLNHMAKNYKEKAKYFPLKKAHDAAVKHLHEGKEESPLKAETISTCNPDLQSLLKDMTGWFPQDECLMTQGVPETHFEHDIQPSARHDWNSLPIRGIRMDYKTFVGEGVSEELQNVKL